MTHFYVTLLVFSFSHFETLNKRASNQNEKRPDQFTLFSFDSEYLSEVRLLSPSSLFLF